MFVLGVIAAATLGGHALSSRAPVTCTLANGDRLTGELVSAGRSYVTITHPSLGRVELERSAIASCEASDTSAIRKLGALALKPFDVEPVTTFGAVPQVILPLELAGRTVALDRLIHPLHPTALATRELPTTVSHVGWKRALGTTYMMSRGNANVSSMGFTGAIARRSDRSQVALKAKREFGSQDGASTENYLSATLRYDLALGANDSSAASRPSFFSEAVYEHDPFAKVGRRAVENTGLSVPLSASKSDKLALELGVGLTNQQPTGADSFTRLGGLLRLAAHQLIGGAQADQSIAVFPDLTGSAGHYRLTGDFNLAAPIARAIALKIGLANRYDTQPAENVRKSDTTIQSGVALEF